MQKILVANRGEIALRIKRQFNKALVCIGQSVLSIARQATALDITARNDLIETGDGRIRCARRADR